MTPLFGHVFRREQAPESLPPLDVELPGEAPPRPQAPRGVPVTTPRLWAAGGALTPEFDPCGRGPIQVGDGSGKEAVTT